MSGVLIGDKHTFNDWCLIWSDAIISLPEQHTSIVSVPYRDGDLDLTSQICPHLKYKNRNLQLKFVIDDRDIRKWHILYSNISNYVHGSVHKVILDTDEKFFYYGRCSCEIEKTDAVISRFIINVNCDPYKYEIYGGIDKWVWYTFDFRTDIIREYKDLIVDGELKLTIPGRKKQVTPKFECSEQLVLNYGGGKYNLSKGKSIVPEISLGEGEHILTFEGKAKVSIDYRGGIL